LDLSVSQGAQKVNGFVEKPEKAGRYLLVEPKPSVAFVTSRIEDLPEWFELHPTEVSGFAACSMTQKKLARGYKPGEPLYGPNLWRVLTGDRIVRIRIGDAETGNQTLVAFKSNALVFGERHIHLTILFGSFRSALPLSHL
jgi:hypothetical protein